MSTFRKMHGTRPRGILKLRLLVEYLAGFSPLGSMLFRNIQKVFLLWGSMLFRDNAIILVPHSLPPRLFYNLKEKIRNDNYIVTNN